jgi:xanthine/CO dehydrogenase XdhC/CoxF family maturation factor
MAKRGKRIDDLAELLRAALPIAARGGIVDQDATHLIILGGTSPSTRRAAAGQSLYPAFSVRSAGRARTEVAGPMRMRRLVLIRLFVGMLPLPRRQRTAIWQDVSFITVQTWCLSSTMSLRCQNQSISVL